MTAKLGRDASSTESWPPGALPVEERMTRYQNTMAASKRISALIPGGVDSPFRAFHEVGGEAIFFEKALGSKLIDIDGNMYVDYLGAWGPAILGHAPEETTRAVFDVLRDGAVFGAPHRLEYELAERIARVVPSIESVRFVSSGTEAVMSAIRLARGYTGRSKIIVFAGAYHGHSDSVLGSTGHVSSSGLLDGTRNCTLLAEYNSPQSVEELCAKNEVAAIVVEPVCGSMGVVLPRDGFLAELRKIADKYGALLVFDEVITGFRVARGGAQEYFDVEADLVCYGKALGGGMPIGAYGGRRDIMHKLMPLGEVYQAGTFSGNPVTMAGGIATLDALHDGTLYATLEERSARLCESIDQLARSCSYPLTTARAGSMFGLSFAPHAVHDQTSSRAIDAAAYARFFHYLLDEGVYMPPSAFDAALVSSAHTTVDIDYTLTKMKAALAFAFADRD